MDELILTLSMQVDGQHFSCQGPKADVLRLFQEWKDLTGLELTKAQQNTQPFNTPRIVQH